MIALVFNLVLFFALSYLFAYKSIEIYLKLATGKNGRLEGMAQRRLKVLYRAKYFPIYNCGAAIGLWSTFPLVKQ